MDTKTITSPAGSGPEIIPVLSDLPTENLTIKEAIKQFGLEYLRGKPIVDGSSIVYIANGSLDDAIDLWADEPENQHRHRRFYGAAADNPPDRYSWIYSSMQLATASDLNAQGKPL